MEAVTQVRAEISAEEAEVAAEAEAAEQAVKDEIAFMLPLAEDGSDQERNSTLAIKFTLEPVQNDIKTKKRGRPIFDDVAFITIRIPGDIDTRVRPVRIEDKVAYPRAYLAFLRKESQHAVSGTPLAEWGQMKRNMIEEAKHQSIHTVEQLSALTDPGLQRLGPGWQELRQKARDYVAQTKDGAALGRLRDELETERSQRKTLEGMLKEQGVKIDQLMKAQPQRK